MNQINHPRLLFSGSSWHLFTISWLYFAQGMPWGFLGIAVTNFLSAQEASLKDIAYIISMGTLPWTIKFGLGPIVDYITISKFGRRRFWIILSQLAMSLTLLIMYLYEIDQNNIFLLGIFILLVNLFVAFQDIATDALATDSLNEETLGKANGLMWGSKVIAKSIGLAVATSIYLNYGLQIGFLALAILMLIVVVVPILSIERPIHNSSLTLIQIKDETLKGLKNPKAKWAVLFLIISSIGNGVYEPIISKFLIDNHNWDPALIANVRATGTLMGGLLGLSIGFISSFLLESRSSFTVYNLLRVLLLVESLSYLLYSVFSVSLPESLGFLLLMLIDISIACSTVIVLSSAMSISNTLSSATLFGLYMGFSNFSFIIGSQIVGSSFGNYPYPLLFIFASLTLLPCLFIVDKFVMRHDS